MIDSPTHDIMAFSLVLEEFLKTLPGNEDGLDAGVGLGSRDLWAEYKGCEYLIQIKPSGKGVC